MTVIDRAIKAIWQIIYFTLVNFQSPADITKAIRSSCSSLFFRRDNNNDEFSSCTKRRSGIFLYVGVNIELDVHLGIQKSRVADIIEL